MTAREASHTLLGVLPAPTRLALIPLATTALFVQSGEALVRILACWVAAVPGATPKLSRVAIEQRAIDDGHLLLLCANVLFVIFFLGRIVQVEQRLGGRSDPETRVLALVTATLSVTQIVGLVATSWRPHLLVYALFFLAYFVLVPLLAIRVPGDACERMSGTGDPRLPSVVAAATSFAASMAVGGLLVLSFAYVWFLLVNEVLKLASPACWALGPAALAICTIQLTALDVKNGLAEFQGTVSIHGRTATILFAGAIVMNFLMAAATVDAHEVFPGANRLGSVMWLIEGVIGVAFTALFVGAFFAIRASAARTGLRGMKLVLLGSAGFGLAGGLAGLSILAAHGALGTRGCIDFNPLHLLWMHGVGFIMSWLALLGISRVVRTYLPSMRPLVAI